MEVATGSGALLRGRTRNISRGGLCVELGEELSPGEDVEVRIALLFHGQRQSKPLALPARIVWCTPFGDVFQIGSQFRRLAREQLAYLDTLLHAIHANPQRRVESTAPIDGGDDDPFVS